MKVSIPAQEKEVCDHCGRDGVLTTCLVCGKQYCLLCDCYLPGCMVRPDVCKKCDDRDDVKALSERYGKRLHKICVARDKEMRALSANDSKLRGGGEQKRS